jgi:hypothetical protein
VRSFYSNVPTTTISPLDCTATELGLLSPLVTNDAVVVPISIPVGVYSKRPNTSSAEPALGMLIPATTARSPLDSSMAVKAVALPPWKRLLQ